MTTAATPIHPGEYLRDEMAAQTKVQERGWTIWCVASRSCTEHGHLSVATVRGIVEGSLPIDERIAAGLARAFGTSAKVWLNLQAAWNEEAPPLG